MTRIEISTSDRRRFWAKVKRGPACWTWTAGKAAHGYGAFSVAGGKQILAHRVAWIMRNGPVPRGLSILHKCNNKGCVRPGHLYAGTQRQNIHDWRGAWLKADMPLRFCPAKPPAEKR